VSPGQTSRILAFAGSARRESYNRKLIAIASAGVEAAGVQCTLVDFRDYPLPLYDADLEAREGLPEHAPPVRS
jgi:NAD(P)H-dependent FMN reductase